MRAKLPDEQDPIFLSIIIPAYNEQERLPDTLNQILGFRANQPYNTEILVIENGSQDRTYTIACEYARAHPGIRVLQEEKPGKGRAVQTGILAARGEYRFMCDADLSMPITEVNRFFPPALEPTDIAIASREYPGAIRYNEPAYRHFTGRVFNTLIRLTVLPGLQDTQCGFKCFRGAVADKIFRRQTLIGWSFDVEVLYIAHHLGYQIREIPIPWYYNPSSRIRLLPDAWQMGMDLFRIRQNARRGIYDSKTAS